MSFEVELKAPCPGAEAKVAALGAVHEKTQTQEDTYFTHPSRDFRQTDEALRIRKADGLVLTYKGPKQSSDVKSREEIEFPVPEDAFQLLARLGFKKAFTIRKTRRTYGLDGLTLCCDLVEGLGEYVEVESKDQQDSKRILSVMAELGVGSEATAKTYSELLGF
jgi:adenylate cyclase class 2